MGGLKSLQLFEPAINMTGFAGLIMLSASLGFD
jgi:hypothetical protein